MLPFKLIYIATKSTKVMATLYLLLMPLTGHGAIAHKLSRTKPPKAMNDRREETIPFSGTTGWIVLNTISTKDGQRIALDKNDPMPAFPPARQHLKTLVCVDSPYATCLPMAITEAKTRFKYRELIMQGITFFINYIQKKLDILKYQFSSIKGQMHTASLYHTLSYLSHHMMHPIFIAL
ncbi:hypothetical protein [Cardinium endosymbiont of Sogatella furcifera]|uniref:hypothetical protein n=1 Tax=Cardinium endosymbiont of Sogatella furcifera TaxID=650378 RepID=UPI000E0DBAE3|nr:hypothetical protein [Cardinium endosymbiont of Sogatella furcifera]